MGEEEILFPKEPEEPKGFFINDNYIIVPTLNIERINSKLLQFYKEKDIEIKLRLHSKSEYEFTGKIIKMYGSTEQEKEEDEEDRLEEIKQSKTTNTNVGYIPRPPLYQWFYIILKDKDNEIKLYLADIDHRTIMSKDVQAVKPLQIFEREPIPAKLRFETLEKYNHTCQYCGRKAPEVELQIDHIIPISKGGLTESNNLTVSCRDCNVGKSNKILNQ